MLAIISPDFDQIATWVIGSAAVLVLTWFLKWLKDVIERWLDEQHEKVLSEAEWREAVTLRGEANVITLDSMRECMDGLHTEIKTVNAEVQGIKRELGMKG
jgi:hypothetical protein